MVKILLQAPPHNLRNLKKKSIINQLHVLKPSHNQVKEKNVYLVKSNQHLGKNKNSC
jgi:hypothetical protein